MASCFGGSLRALLECVQGPSFSATPSYAHMVDEPDVNFDPAFQGTEVVVVKGGRRVCGSGGVLSSSPIVQDKAYFEAKLQQGGAWAIGLGPRERSSLNSLPPLKADQVTLEGGSGVVVDSSQLTGSPVGFWLLREDGGVYEGGEEKGRAEKVVEEGDVVGVSWDHVEMGIFINGERMGAVSGLRGCLFPALFVDDGAILDVAFSAASFWHSPPPGFGEIMLEQTLL